MLWNLDRAWNACRVSKILRPNLLIAPLDFHASLYLKGASTYFSFSFLHARPTDKKLALRYDHYLCPISSADISYIITFPELTFHVKTEKKNTHVNPSNTSQYQLYHFYHSSICQKAKKKRSLKLFSQSYEWSPAAMRPRTPRKRLNPPFPKLLCEPPPHNKDVRTPFSLPLSPTIRTLSTTLTLVRISRDRPVKLLFPVVLFQIDI